MKRKPFKPGIAIGACEGCGMSWRLHMDGRVNDLGFFHLPDGWRRIEFERAHELCGECVEELEELFDNNCEIQANRKLTA
jgi:hypothetical protein